MSVHQHEKFLERLTQSMGAVMSVAAWLNRAGRTIEIPAIRYAPTAADATMFYDEGDIVVLDRKIIQVKGISRDFTSAADWPFHEYFVSNQAAVDRMQGRVAAYVTVSNDKRHAAIVESSTKGNWYLKDVRASNTGNVERFYVSPLSCVVFRSLEQRGQAA